MVNKFFKDNILWILLVVGLFLFFSNQHGDSITNIFNTESVGSDSASVSEKVITKTETVPVVEQSLAPEECNDPDEMDITLKSKVTGFTYSGDEKQSYVVEDVCFNDFKLYEQTCDGNQLKPLGDPISCWDAILGICDAGACRLPETADEACKMNKQDVWSPISGVQGFVGTEQQCNDIAPLVQRSDYIETVLGGVCCHIGDA